MLPIFVATKPLNSELGNIRGDCSIETLRNIVYWSAMLKVLKKKLNHGSILKKSKTTKEIKINGFMDNLFP